MDFLQNLQNILGGAAGSGPQNSMNQYQNQPQARPASGGLGGSGLGSLLTPAVLGSLAGALLAGKRGGRSMNPGNPNALNLPSGMSGGTGALGGMLGQIMGGAGGGLLGQLAGGLLSGKSGAQAAAAPRAFASNASSDSGKAERMIRTLVYAAKADGHIDDSEQRTIDSQLRQLNVGPEGQAFVRRVMEEPLDPAAIARGVTDPSEAAQIYALSCALTDQDHFMERGYLDSLASALGITPQLKNAIEARTSGQRTAR